MLNKYTTRCVSAALGGAAAVAELELAAAGEVVVLVLPVDDAVAAESVVVVVVDAEETIGVDATSGANSAAGAPLGVDGALAAAFSNARLDALCTRCIRDAGASNSVIDPFIGIRNCTRAHKRASVRCGAAHATHNRT